MSLFKTTQDLRGYYPARLTFSIDDLLPTLREVEQEYLAEQVLGQPLYETLEAEYQDNATEDTMDPQLKALLDKCRPAVANMAVFRYTGIGNVEFTSGGLAVTGGNNSDRVPASEWRTRDLERTVLRSAYRALDVLVNWILEHADDYPEWQATSIYTALTSGFVRTTAQFEAEVRIGNSGFLFRQMVPTLRDIEDGALLGTLCSTDLRDELVTAINDDSLSAEQSAVVKLARKAACHLAMSKCIAALALDIDPQRGVYTYNSLLGGQTSGGPTAANDERLRQRMQYERELGNGFLEELRKTLQAQAEADSNHPYGASACYIDPNAAPPERFKTDGPVGGFMA